MIYQKVVTKLCWYATYRSRRKTATKTGRFWRSFCYGWGVSYYILHCRSCYITFYTAHSVILHFTLHVLLYYILHCTSCYITFTLYALLYYILHCTSCYITFYTARTVILHFTMHVLLYFICQNVFIYKGNTVIDWI